MAYYILKNKIKSARNTNIEKVKITQNPSHRVNHYFGKQNSRLFSLCVCVFVYVRARACSCVCEII